MFHLCAGGLETEQEYPYDAVGETCKFEKSEAVVYVNGSVSISKDETSEFHPVHNFCQFATTYMYTCTVHLRSICPSPSNLAKVHVHRGVPLGKKCSLFSRAIIIADN